MPAGMGMRSQSCLMQYWAYVAVPVVLPQSASGSTQCWQWMYSPARQREHFPQYPCGKCSLCLAGEYIHCQHCVDPLALCGSTTGTATYAQYCIKQDWLLIPIPAGMSYDDASMACCG